MAYLPTVDEFNKADDSYKEAFASSILNKVNSKRLSSQLVSKSMSIRKNIEKTFTIEKENSNEDILTKLYTFIVTDYKRKQLMDDEKRNRIATLQKENDERLYQVVSAIKSTDKGEKESDKDKKTFGLGLGIFVTAGIGMMLYRNMNELEKMFDLKKIETDIEKLSDEFSIDSIVNNIKSVIGNVLDEIQRLKMPDLSFDFGDVSTGKGTVDVTLEKLPSVSDTEVSTGKIDAWDLARQTQQKTGVPADLIMAQMGMESAYGKHIPAGSNNPFGIKARKGEEYVEAMTSEFEHGQMIRKPQKFRKFKSLDEAFVEYAGLIKRRYPEAAAAKTPEGMAKGVARSGYATDPLYESKLLGIFRGKSFRKPKMIQGSLGNVGKSVPQQIKDTQTSSAPMTSPTATKEGKYYGYYTPKGLHSGLLSDEKFLSHIDMVEKKHGIPAGTLQAIMAKESKGDPNAVSPADKQGLHGWGIGQFRNATARGLAKQTGIPIWKDNKVNMDPYVQATAMGELLSRKRKAVGGSWDDAVWAYNAGEGAVLEYKKTGSYGKLEGKADPKYKKEVLANRDAILGSKGKTPPTLQQTSTDKHISVPKTAEEKGELDNNAAGKQISDISEKDVSGIATDSDLVGLTFINNPKEQRQILKALAVKVQQLKSAIGVKSFIINSGYRSPAYNAALRKRGGGAAKNSLHMHRMAVDINCNLFNTSQRAHLIRLASKIGFGGIGVYPSFIHFDIGKRRTWQGDGYRVPGEIAAALNEHRSGKLSKENVGTVAPPKIEEESGEKSNTEKGKIKQEELSSSVPDMPVPEQEKTKPFTFDDFINQQVADANEVGNMITSAINIMKEPNIAKVSQMMEQFTQTIPRKEKLNTSTSSINAPTTNIINNTKQENNYNQNDFSDDSPALFVNPFLAQLGKLNG